MAVQDPTDYSIDHGAATAGAVVDGQLKNIRSAVVTAGALAFGRFCAYSAAGTVNPVAAGQIAAGLGAGFVARTQDDVANSSDILQKEIGKDASVLDFGEIWVETTEAVAITDSVFVVVTAGADQGKVRTDATGAEALAGARFMSATSGAGLAKLQVRL